MGLRSGLGFHSRLGTRTRPHPSSLPRRLPTGGGSEVWISRWSGPLNVRALKSGTLADGPDSGRFETPAMTGSEPQVGGGTTQIFHPVPQFL